jgi:hypothetical protein
MRTLMLEVMLYQLKESPSPACSGSPCLVYPFESGREAANRLGGGNSPAGAPELLSNRPPHAIVFSSGCKG